jgi:hypothetical protein
MILTIDQPTQDRVAIVQEVLVTTTLPKAIPTLGLRQVDPRVTTTAHLVMTEALLRIHHLAVATQATAQGLVREEVVAVRRHLVDQAQVVDHLEDQDNFQIRTQFLNPANKPIVVGGDFFILFIIKTL